MEFHDILHGLIRIDDREISRFLADLLESPEVHRLRNMRQMNFDVPLIQELGRSRRLPHSIGVAHLAYVLTKGVNIHKDARKAFIAAALLHDAAIPPFGHLVESELRAKNPEFSHENRLNNLIFGLDGKSNKYGDVVHGKPGELIAIFEKHNVSANEVLKLVCPEGGSSNAISAGIDIDNIDNVHRMACMLGWHEARHNMECLMSLVHLSKDGGLVFDPSAEKYVQIWMEIRSRIYTMIIAHPQCIPHNALQADVSRIAVDCGIITAGDWRMTEPEFEEKLRSSPETGALAWQLISGCEYSLEDYVWFKGYEDPLRVSNRRLAEEFSGLAGLDAGYSVFVWNESGLITRRINILMSTGEEREIGKSSRSCMVALVRTRSSRRGAAPKRHDAWRRAVMEKFSGLTGYVDTPMSTPEDYNGEFEASDAGLKLEYH